MKEVIALRHIGFEDLGTFKTILNNRRYQIKYLDIGVDNICFEHIQEADILIILGGPIGAYDEEKYPFLLDELKLIKNRIKDNKPILGICLGAQLIARALGAEVYPMGVKEIGFSQLELTIEGNNSVLKDIDNVPVLHWHGDQFDIPIGALHLARTSVGENQAFSFGNKILGLQFHLEVDIKRIEQWLIGHANELNQANINILELRKGANQVKEELTVASGKILNNWLDNLEK